MEDQKIFLYLIVWVIIACLIIGVYVLSLPKEALLIISKATLAYLLLVIVFLTWGFIERHRIKALSQKILRKYENLEQLLFDIRDGTKKFHNEKRKFNRKNCVMRAKIPDTSKDEFMKVLDISYTGALLRTTHNFQHGNEINLNLYLPIFAQPINIMAKVVRVDPGRDEDRSECFDIGIEYLDMAPIDKEKLVEAVNLLNQSIEEEMRPS